MQPKLVTEVWPRCCLGIWFEAHEGRSKSISSSLLLWSSGFSSSWYFCVEAFLITTCINMRGSRDFLLSLQWDTGSHSRAWGFILSKAWILRSSPKPICKCLPFLGQQHKDGSESTAYIVPESAACVLLLSASRFQRKLGSFGFIICQTKRFVGN